MQNARWMRPLEASPLIHLTKLGDAVKSMGTL